ncbi:MAG: alcohol dehydrogenase catalytic domain-containing protein [Treponema sp.]|nr:alcohol dehydrogenase catalytic domain-containing protein [Treponema sp.]
MKAAVWYGRRDVRIEERAEPEALPGHVVVRVAWAGICGTDRHEYLGPNFIPLTKPHRLTGCTAPLILGHEFTGLIHKIGQGLGSSWRIGDRVTANGTLCCGTCAMCRSGQYNICEKLGFTGVSRDGAFAEYVAVEAERLFRVPDALTLRQAVLAEPLACGIHAVRLLGGLQGKDAVIIGPGIIGLSCFFAAKRSGARRLLAAGIAGPRRGLVEAQGGWYCDCEQEDLGQAARACFGGLADAVFECAGSQAALNSAAAVLKGGGDLMVMGVYEQPPVFPMNGFQEGERRLFTSQAHQDEIGAALDYLKSGDLDPDALITGEVTLDTLVDQGFEELAANAGKHIKIVIRIGGDL